MRFMPRWSCVCITAMLSRRTNCGVTPPISRRTPGKQLGIKLTRRAPGVGDLEVYFDPVVAMEEKIIFSKYVHEHLL